ncbi:MULTISPECIES: adenosine deaminase [Kocuria]|uniref:adenosine deaminase n=1 Tax=Kocuria subflava TaxID=1736139 RepID=A0A846TXQ2_9MICC|nr:MULTISPECIES: adenosine deaminase [Kocuria]NKE09085.1 adenosine deaminase [Kocuria subflava]
MTESQNTPDPDVESGHGGILRALPKISLHDHLDGSLRPATVVDLARSVNHSLPVETGAELARWMVEAGNSGSLESYLTTFEHTLAVLQSADALRRVAREAVEDYVDDGVIHAEVRWAPEQHQAQGLSLTDAVEAVQAGLTEGIEAAAAEGHEISVGQLLCAMRQNNRSLEIAQLVVDRYDPGAPGGVLGFDLAGPEDGFLPGQHQEALDLLAQNLIPVTLHAGEAAGIESIRGAVVDGRALRLGHGVRIVEDIMLTDAADGDVSIDLGPVATWVRDRGIVLEVCPESNRQTHATPTWNPPENLVRVLGPGTATHPVGFLHRAGFRVSLGPDNRLVSGTEISDELGRLVNLHGFSMDDVETLQRNAAQTAFVPLDHRVMLEARITEEFAALRDAGTQLGLGDLLADQELLGGQEFPAGHDQLDADGQW